MLQCKQGTRANRALKTRPIAPEPVGPVSPAIQHRVCWSLSNTPPRTEHEVHPNRTRGQSKARSPVPEEPAHKAQTCLSSGNTPCSKSRYHGHNLHVPHAVTRQPSHNTAQQPQHADTSRICSPPNAMSASPNRAETARAHQAPSASSAACHGLPHETQQGALAANTGC